MSKFTIYAIILLFLVSSSFILFLNSLLNFIEPFMVEFLNNKIHPSEVYS